MRERNFIYAQEVTIPAGGGLVKLTVQLTTGDFAAQFPFIMRAIEAHTAEPDTDGESVFFQLRRFDGSFIDNAPVRLKTILNARYPTDWLPRWPAELYPATSVIEVDCYNFGLVSAAVTFHFFGVHLVPDSFDTPFSYPGSYTETAFDYLTSEEFSAGQVRVSNHMMTVRDDSDFCLRGLAGAVNPDSEEPTDLRLRIKSIAGVPYSNVPILWQFVAGVAIPEKPRWFWPPIYLPRNSYLLLDWVRNDAGGAASDVRLRWIGAKIQGVCR